MVTSWVGTSADLPFSDCWFCIKHSSLRSGCNSDNTVGSTDGRPVVPEWRLSPPGSRDESPPGATGSGYCDVQTRRQSSLVSGGSWAARWRVRGCGPSWRKPKSGCASGVRSADPAACRIWVLRISQAALVPLPITLQTKKSIPLESKLRKYVFDVTSVGQRLSPWPCNSVKVDLLHNLVAYRKYWGWVLSFLISLDI